MDGVMIRRIPDRCLHLRRYVAMDSSGTDMGGFCRNPEGQWFVWRSQFSTETQSRLVSNTNPKGDVTINDL